MALSYWNTWPLALPVTMLSLLWIAMAVDMPRPPRLVTLSHRPAAAAL